MSRLTPSETRPSSRDLVIAGALGLLVLVVLLLTRPFADAPMNDDFSYARTAESLARTGHIVYNGWGSPLLWPQAAYGALVIRAVGFSYPTLAATGVFMAVLSTGMFYLLARRCRVRPACAVLATLVLTMNPVFLSVAPSFMTDVPSLFLFLVMLLTLVSALKADAEGQSVLEPKRLFLSAGLALLAGSNRQIIWVTYLFALVVLFALFPRQRRMIALVFGLTLDGAFMMNYWYDSQPYTISPEMAQGIRRLMRFPGAVFQSIARYLNLMGLLLLPLSALSLPRLRVRGIRPSRFYIMLGVWLIAIFLPYDNPSPMPSFGIFSYGHYFTSHGALIGGPPGFSRRPEVLCGPAPALLEVAGAVSMTILSLLFPGWVADQWSVVRRGERVAPEKTALALVLGACFVQFPICLVWFCCNFIFDRYLLLFLPGFLIFLAAQAGETEGVTRSLWRGAVGLTAAVGILGFAFAQEYAAYGHARADLYHFLRNAGVPARAINAGFEMDADTQIQTTGYVNHPEVVKPRGAFNPNVKAPHVSLFPEMFPALDPYYRISSDPVVLPNEDAFPTPVRVATYRSLLPPFERQMYIYRIRR